MSDTSTKAPPEPTTVVADSDGQHTPIEITLNQTPADDTSTDSGGGKASSRTPVRALPLALFGTEAAATGGAALYGAAGTIGLVTAAGVVAGGGVVVAAVAARRAARNSPLGGGRGGRGGGSGFGAGRGRGGGQRSALGSTGRAGSKLRGSTPGAFGGRGQGRGGPAGRGGGVPSPRPGTSRGMSLTKPPRPNAGGGQTRSGLRSSGLGAATGGRAGAGTSGGLGGRQGGSGSAGKGGLLRRLGLRRNGAGGAGTSGGTSTGPSGVGTAGKAGGKSRSTLAAAARRAGRAGLRATAAAVKAGRAVAGSSAARSAGTKARAARRGVAKAANTARKRARIAWAAAVKKGKAGMRYLLRSAAAKVAAGAVGAIAMVPGLIGRSVAVATGGLLRFLRLAPRNGTKWGVRCTRWAAHVAKKVHTRLMARAKDRWVADTRPDVATDFDEPGHTTTPPADPFGNDYFGGNCVSVFQTETEAVRQAYAAYEPPMMLAVAAEYWGLTESVASVGEALRQLAVNTADKYPADKRMADQVAQVYALLHRAAEAAQEVGPLFAKVHEHDLRRLEEPRPGEHMWNILERRADGGYDQRQPSRLVAVTQDIAHVYARYEPGHMKQIAAEYEGVPAGIENIAATISLLQTRSNEVYPVDKTVVEALATVHQLLMQAASAAQELMPSFRRLHAPDIARHEDPRNGDQGEAMWDV
ncbi:hypothetical protein ACFV2V_29810 [Streptomyces sp. NPDC059698]|uniref:hypothetical protein n=1 Tax=unclassified Streptomyces TaxID=2593676 RepID=UPI00093B724C|nr:hypothetical protein [Streptomyces sp. CB02366]OKJ29656.1 hypothetical protein AMK24_29570 [Streptomyces sp. CB02366]